MSAYRFSLRSLKELAHCHPDLRRVAEAAIKDTEIDFTITDGGRTLEEQKKLVASGASQTLESRHLISPRTGYCYAIDAAPYVNGKIRWEWPLIFKVAEAMRKAAKSQCVAIRWLGAPDIANFTETTATPKYLHEQYVAKRKKAGRKPFFDGPHFELVRSKYPA